MRDLNFFAIFMVDYLYYIPQFLPLAKELQKRNLDFLFILPKKKKRDIIPTLDIAIKVCEEHNIVYKINEDINSFTTCNFLISGSNSFPETKIAFDQSVLIVHGVGTKTGYFTEEQNKYDIRFVEGEFRYRKIKELYPEYKGTIENVGFSKLDDVINMNQNEKNVLLNKYHLDPNKETILYAPTFYPSSIEKMSKKFPEEFKNYNILIKPHYFSYLRKKYKKQRKLLEKWNEFDNVFVAGIEEYNLVPFFALSDIMISDESSAIFEFAALNKPVICNQFLHYRLKYRIFKSKINKKMDSNMTKFKEIAECVNSYKDLKEIVIRELKHPNFKEEIRKKYTKEIIGPTDGNVAKRMIEILLKTAK